MIKQVIIACGLYVAYFIGLVLIDTSLLSDTYFLAFNILFVLWLWMEASKVKLGHKQAKKYGTYSRLFLLLSFMAVAVALVDYAVNFQIINYKLPETVFTVGLVLLLLGVYLRYISIKILGKFFVTKVQVTEDHELVKDGIYKVLRHPSYTGLILGFMGSVLMLQSAFATAIFVMLGIPAYIYRIIVEEKALISAFGEDYKAYRNDTYAIIPFLY